MGNPKTLTIPERDSERLRDIVARWSSIQAEIKRAEQISRLAVGPAVNELRYAGRMLVAAFVKEIDSRPIPQDENDDENINTFTFSEKLAVADQYLINAENDISDSLIYFFQTRADEINGRYGAAAIIARHSEYGKFLANLDSARRLIIESRRNTDERQRKYLELKSLRDDLINDYFSLQASETLMAVEIYRKDREVRNYKTASYILTALAALLAVAILI